MTASSTYTVELVWEGKEESRSDTVEAREDETVLGASEEDGVALPFGCRTGACGTCTGRLIDGRVEHRRPTRALKERHAGDGYVLLCIAEPRADCRIAVGKEVASGLFSNPWK